MNGTDLYQCTYKDSDDTCECRQGHGNASHGVVVDAEAGVESAFSLVNGQCFQNDSKKLILKWKIFTKKNYF